MSDKCPACGTDWTDHQGLAATCENFHHLLSKWEGDRALLRAALKIIHDKGLTVTSADLIVAAREIDETRHKLFLAEERLRQEGILEYGN